MTEKIRSWWSDDGKWFCILANDGVNQATVSLTPEQAEQLARLEGKPEMNVLPIRVMPRELDVVQRYELIKVAAETSIPEIRERALELLRPMPFVTVSAAVCERLQKEGFIREANK